MKVKARTRERFWMISNINILVNIYSIKLSWEFRGTPLLLSWVQWPLWRQGWVPAPEPGTGGEVETRRSREFPEQCPWCWCWWRCKEAGRGGRSRGWTRARWGQRYRVSTRWLSASLSGKLKVSSARHVHDKSLRVYRHLLLLQFLQSRGDPSVTLQVIIWLTRTLTCLSSIRLVPCFSFISAKLLTRSSVLSSLRFIWFIFPPISVNPRLRIWSSVGTDPSAAMICIRLQARLAGLRFVKNKTENRIFRKLIKPAESWSKTGGQGQAWCNDPRYTFHRSQLSWLLSTLVTNSTLNCFVWIKKPRTKQYASITTCSSAWARCSVPNYRLASPDNHPEHHLVPH